MDSIFKLNETDKLFNRNYLYTDRKCDFNKIHDWMKITNNEVKNVNGQYNFRKLIDTYQNKVQKMIDNSKHACEKCNIQFIDTDMSKNLYPKNGYVVDALTVGSRSIWIITS